MKNFKFLIFFPVLLSLSSTQVFSHVALDYPAGGETFMAGESVNIQWHVVIPHSQENWDLYFSADGGTTWEAVQLNLPVNQLNYQWVVPRHQTQNGRIKIYSDNSGTDYEDSSGDFVIQNSPTQLKEPDQPAGNFVLYQNFPNPFNPVTTIEYLLLQPSLVVLKIFDPLGREIITLIDEFQTSGRFNVKWNGLNKHRQSVPSGIYIYRLKSGQQTRMSKMLLLR